MARRIVPVPIVEALARHAEGYRRQLLIQSYRVIYNDVLGLLARGAAPTQKSKSMSRRLAEIEVGLQGKPMPDQVVLAPLGEMWKRAAPGDGALNQRNCEEIGPRLLLTKQ